MLNRDTNKFHPGQFLFFFALVNTIFFCVLGFNYLKIAFSSSTLFATSFYAYHTFMGKLLVITFGITTYLGQFALLAYLPNLILFPLFSIIRNKWFVLSVSIATWSLLAFLLIIDSAIFSMFHFHLNLTLINVFIDRDFQIQEFIEFNNTEISIIVIASLIIIAIQTICAYLIFRKSSLHKWRRAARLTCSILFSCLLFSYITLTMTIIQRNNVLAQQTPNFPLYNQIISLFFLSKDGLSTINEFSETRFSQPLFPNTPLHYPLHPLQCKAEKKQYNILLIGIDTWRYDTFNQKVTPHLYRLSNRAWIFKQHMSGGNSTQAGLFSLFYGLPGNYWSAMMENKQGALLIDEAIKQNYAIRIFFSAAMIPFNKTIFLNAHPLRTKNAGKKSPPDNDRVITNEFKQYINKRNKSQPFFTFIFYDSAHDYYSKQNIPSVYPVKEIEKQRLVALTNDNNRKELHNKYRNAVHFIDTQINQLIMTLKDKKQLDNTIIIITGDHGEEFNDNHQRYWGHGSNYTATQIQVPLIVLWPGQSPKVWDHLTSHYDIAPYLMSQAFGCQNIISDYSIGEDLLKTHQNPFLLVGSYINMGIVEPTKNTTLFTSGHIVIADNKARTLPNERVDTNILKQALWMMRKYFATHSPTHAS